MIEILIKNFSLSTNSIIYNYISQIVSEHEKILQKFLEIWYKIEEVALRESLRDGNIFVNLNENEKFENFLKNLGRSEFVLQIFFSHLDFENFDGPWSVVKIELSHHSFSGSF